MSDINVPLVPVITQANATIDQPNANAFLTQILSLTPLPAGKTASQIIGHHLSVNRNGTISVNVSFNP